MANRKKYKDPVKKNIVIEKDNLLFIQEYCSFWGISDTDFINKAIEDRISKIKKDYNNG